MNPMVERLPAQALCRRGVSIVLVFLLAGVSSQVYAQEAQIEAQVTYIAGQNIYLDAGHDLGIQTGDTLTVYRDEGERGRLVVISSTATRSVVTFAATPFPVTLGTHVQLVVWSPRDDEAPEPPPVAEDEEEQPAVRPEPVASRASSIRRRADARRGPRVVGRIMVSLNALQSTTRWIIGQGGSTKRTFLTPSLNLHTTITNLPQGLRLRTRLRADYRYSSRQMVGSEVAVRAYEVLLEKDFTRFAVQAGRFSNRYAPFGGYWDGALIHYGGRRNGFGTAIGFMPDHSNEGFSSDMPRYAGFAHVEIGDGAGPRYAAEVSFNEIRPTNDLLTHRFLGFSHTLKWGGAVSLRNDVQLDRDPETGAWIASRFAVRGAFALHRRLRLHSRVTVRQPYSIWRVQRIISYRRDQASAGFSWQFARATLGGDVTVNFIDDGFGQRVQDGRTLSGYLQVPKTGMLDLGFSTIASYWRDGDGSSLYMNTGVTRAFGKARMRLNYQFYRTEVLTSPVLTHAFVMQTVVPLAHDFFTNSQVRLQQSSALRSAALYLSLWYSF